MKHNILKKRLQDSMMNNFIGNGSFRKSKMNQSMKEPALNEFKVIVSNAKSSL